MIHASGADAEVDVEEEEGERAAEADWGCNGVKGVRCFVGVVGVVGDVGTKCRREGRSQWLQDGGRGISAGIEKAEAYHKHIRGGFCCSLLSRYQRHQRMLSTPRRDCDNPQR